MPTKRKASRPFVKSADTQASAANSRAEVEKLLTRYGAVGFGYQVNLEAGTIVVQFVIPDRPGKNAAKIPVTLPVSVRNVYDALYGRPTKEERIPDAERDADDRAKYPNAIRYRTVHDPKGYDARKLEQAERVAWRNLVLWIDAALSAASIGVQTISEAFLAHTMIVSDDGRAERMMSYLERTQGVLAPGVRALLPASTNGGAP